MSSVSVDLRMRALDAPEVVEDVIAVEGGGGVGVSERCRDSGGCLFKFVAPPVMMIAPRWTVVAVRLYIE
jgi:hypothetical protein